MNALAKKPPTFSSGGKFVVNGKVEMEVVAGAMSLLIAMVAVATGRDIDFWSMVISGMAGIFGAFAFLNSADMTRQSARVVAVLLGGGLASLFGPLASNAAGYYLPWLGPVDYFVDAASGALIGLLSTPLLGFLRNPMASISVAMALLPVLSWGKKKDPPQ